MSNRGTFVQCVLHYITAHWRGQQSLAWSFWVNLVALRVVVFTAQSVLSPTEGQDFNAWRTLVIVVVVAVHGVLLLWQIGGVVRAADAHYSHRGNMALVWGAQLGGVLMFLLSAVYGLEAIQMTIKRPFEDDPLARMARERASQYQLTLSASEAQLTIDGFIKLGITKAVRQLLQDHPRVEKVILNSAGGNIYEGRGLAGLFVHNRLDTHVETLCASACTTAYVGGVLRSAAEGATFGFHQYRVDADYSIIVTDVDREQSRDADLFLSAGVSEEFVGRMFSHVAQEMWWPSVHVLHQEGVVHELRR